MTLLLRDITCCKRSTWQPHGIPIYWRVGGWTMMLWWMFHSGDWHHFLLTVLVPQFWSCSFSSILFEGCFRFQLRFKLPTATICQYLCNQSFAWHENRFHMFPRIAPASATIQGKIGCRSEQRQPTDTVTNLLTSWSLSIWTSIFSPQCLHTHTQDFQASSVSKGLLQCRDGFSNDADVGLMIQMKMLWTLACFCSSTACAMVKHSPKVCSSPSFFLWTHHGAVGPSTPSPHPHKPCVPGVWQVRPLH